MAELLPDASTGHEGPMFPPFDTPNAKALLGILDSIFLILYALSLVFWGHVADRVHIRYFLTFGQIGISFSIQLWTLGYLAGIHSYAYYVFANVISGIFQATGWPSVVRAMSRWFPHGKRGMVMCIWNSHTSIGNILGSIIATASGKLGTEKSGWTWSFTIPAIIGFAVAILTFYTLIGSPMEVGCLPSNASSPLYSNETNDIETGDNDVVSGYCNVTTTTGNINKGLLQPNQEIYDTNSAEKANNGDDSIIYTTENKKLTFLGAFQIPGVIEFSLAFLFTKFVAYTFIFWQPLYLKSTGYSTAQAGFYSSYYDIGGILGGILAGILSDRYSKPGQVSTVYMFQCAPTLQIFHYITENQTGGTPVLAILLIIVGQLVNGPYALITTAVSADLGSNPRLGKDTAALAAVSGIIDGAGSIGSAIQGITTPQISGKGDKNWNLVFYSLCTSSLLTAVSLVRIVRHELSGRSILDATPPQKNLKYDEDNKMGNTINENVVTVD